MGWFSARAGSGQMVLRRAAQGEDARQRAIAQLASALDEADAVVVGAGAGLSTAAGLTYSGPRFHELFADFEAAYGFHDMYTGAFHAFDSLEEHWAYWSRFVMCNRYERTPGTVYHDLFELVRDRDYFVLTTNVDHQFQRAGFDKHRLFYTQGDYGLFQCSVPCHQATYDNEDVIRRMVAEQRDRRIPTELVPYCPVCGKPMAMNLRSDGTFVEDEGWHAAAQRWEDFKRRHRRVRVLYLELGVGYNTPVIIKFPFWEQTAANERAVYACINKGEALCPDEIAARSILIDDDIADVLRTLRGSGPAAR